MLRNDFLKVVYDTDDPPGDPPEPVAPTPVVPEKPKTDWEAAYKGLQRQMDKLKKQLEELQTKYDTAIEELEGEKQTHRSVAGEKEGLLKMNVDLTSQVKVLQEQEANRTLEKERYGLILTEFSDLAFFEAKGLLPPGSNIDELRQKFTDFRDALGKTGNDKVQEVLRGTGTGAVGDNNTGKRSKEQVYDELLALSGSQNPKDREKYDVLMKEWIALN